MWFHTLIPSSTHNTGMYKIQPPPSQIFNGKYGSIFHFWKNYRSTKLEIVFKYIANVGALKVSYNFLSKWFLIKNSVNEDT